PLARLLDEQDRGRALLAKMGEEGFWSDRAEAQSVLDAYRDLDVGVRVATRLLSPSSRLEELLARSPPLPAQELARVVEEAARGLRDWSQRNAEAGPRALWLFVRSIDLFADSAEFLERIVEMERAWSRRLHLWVDVVAFGFTDEVLTRAVLEVEGP